MAMRPAGTAADPCNPGAAPSDASRAPSKRPYTSPFFTQQLPTPVSGLRGGHAPCEITLFRVGQWAYFLTDVSLLARTWALSPNQQRVIPRPPHRLARVARRPPSAGAAYSAASRDGPRRRRHRPFYLGQVRRPWRSSTPWLGFGFGFGFGLRLGLGLGSGLGLGLGLGLR